MHPDSTRPIRKLLAGTAFVLSLLLCGVAGRLPNGAEALAPLDGSTASLRLAYLEELGWQVENERYDSVVLPECFDSSYSSYLAIQKECGFDLLPYAGQTVTRYSYDILNYPTGEAGVQLDLLTFDGRIIGGDVRTSQLNGFMHSLVLNEELGMSIKS